MVFAFTLLASFLLASVALAVPSAPAARVDNESGLLARTDEPVSDAGVENSSWWAGAYLNGTAGTFERVFGTITVPTSNDNINIWVGLDGINCPNVLFLTGIAITVSNGQASYSPFYGVDHTEYSYSQSLVINAGDVLTFAVQATSSDTGVVWVENLTTKKLVNQTVTSSQFPRPLCKNSADWMVSDFDTGRALANFGHVTFTDAHAYGPSGGYSPGGATSIVMVQNNEAVTSTTISGDDITVTRL